MNSPRTCFLAFLTHSSADRLRQAEIDITLHIQDVVIQDQVRSLLLAYNLGISKRSF